MNEQREIERIRTAVPAPGADSAYDALREIEGKQQEALAIIRANGFKWESADSLGREPGNWQHLAFTLYSMLCEVQSVAQNALEEARDA